MPTVNMSDEAYAKLEKIAAYLDQTVEHALEYGMMLYDREHQRCLAADEENRKKKEAYIASLQTKKKASQKQIDFIKALYSKQFVVDRTIQFYFDVERFAHVWSKVDLPDEQSDTRRVAEHLTANDLTAEEAYHLILALRQCCRMEMSHDPNPAVIEHIGFYAG